jgi:hypothetical protein
VFPQKSISLSDQSRVVRRVKRTVMMRVRMMGCRRRLIIGTGGMLRSVIRG